MTVFAAAMDRIYANPSMAAAAVWISATTSQERPIRVLRRAPDRITEFGAGRFVSDTMMVDVRVSELPEPRPGDLIVIGAEYAPHGSIPLPMNLLGAFVCFRHMILGRLLNPKSRQVLTMRE